MVGTPDDLVALAEVTPLKLIFLGTFGLWTLAEVLLSIRKSRRPNGAISADRSTFVALWLSIVLGITAGFFVHAYRFTPGPQTRLPILVGTSVLLLGATLRTWAILSLGRYFSTRVTIQKNHEVVRAGPYRRLRHPAYSGLLVALLGTGLALADWMSLVLVLLPATLATLYRIGIEERVLLEALGAEYQTYCHETKRLIPGIF